MENTISREIYKQLDKAKEMAFFQPEMSFKISQEAYHLAKDHKLVLEQGYALISMTLEGRVKSDVASILKYGYEAHTLFKEINHISGQVKALNVMGVAYLYSSMYEEAIGCFSQGKDLLKVHPDDDLLTRILNNIGEVHRESKMHEKAIEYYNQAIEITLKNKWEFNQGVILANLGGIHFEEKDYETALEKLNKSYDILIKHKDIIYLSDVENKIGKVYFALNEFEKAKMYYLDALEKLEKIDNKYYCIDVLLNIAQLYSENSLGPALPFYKKAKRLAKEVGSSKNLCEVYNRQADYYETLGEYKKSLGCFKKYFYLKEELASHDLSGKLKIMAIELKNSETSEEIDYLKVRLEKEIIRQKEELKKLKKSHASLEKKAYEDELTGIHNRRSINAYLKKLFIQQEKIESAIALFMIDIDKFKQYNDYWGHSQGDICLQEIAESVKEIESQRGDVFGRFGGEEFVYIAKVESYQEALSLGNKIREAVEELNLFYKTKNQDQVTTVSVGGVMGQLVDFDSIIEIIELADQGLYKAKNRGRNRLVLTRKETQ